MDGGGRKGGKRDGSGGRNESRDSLREPRIRGDTLTSGRAPGLVIFHLPLARLGPKPTAGELLSSNPESLGLSEESLWCRLGCRVRPACGKTFASTSGGLLVHLAGPRRNLDYWDYQMSAPFFL